jgi:hypothetical protein
MGYTTVIKKLADNSALKSELPIPAGYSQVRGVFSEGQKVFYNGKNYISPDVTSHIGGFWKMAKKVKLLKNPETRMGTYDKLLNKIGD